MKHTEYENFILEIKQKIQKAQVKTALAANAQMLYIYWQIGNDILDNQ